MKLYLSASEPELVTESVPANKKSDDKPTVEERPRRIGRSPPKIRGFCSREALGTV